jgi:hypothetical protein
VTAGAPRAARPSAGRRTVGSHVGSRHSRYARGSTTGEISAHFAQVYGAEVSKDAVSRITEKVIEWGYLPPARAMQA